MRALILLALYILLVFAGGAFIAPPIYWGVQALTEGPFPFLQEIAEDPFRRYLSRCLQILAVLGLWPLIRGLGLRRWADIGLDDVRNHSGILIRGILLGLCSLLVTVVVSLALRSRVLSDETMGWVLIQVALAAALSAFLIAFLEELLFRGAFYHGLTKGGSMPVPAAIGITSLLYAFVHFLDRGSNPASVEWHSGFFVLSRMLEGFQDWQRVLPGFFNLILVGWILCLAVNRTRTLYSAMAIHAGWVFWIRIFGAITRPGENERVWLLGNHQIVNGWLSTLVLALSLLIIKAWFPMAPPPEQSARQPAPA